MKNTLMMLLMLSSFSAAAEMTIKFNCSAPDLEYVNRFSMSATIVTGAISEDEPKSWVSAQSLSGTFTKRGSEQEEQNLKFKVSGRVTRVGSANTLKPYINLKLKNREKTQLMQLNLNYPNKLSSTIKTQDGYLYKSTCKVTSIETCAFGNDYFDALENPAIKKEDMGVVRKEMQAFGEIVPVQKTRITLTNGEVYTMYYTFDDSVDGGNTYGQIEDQKGNVVSRIEDSDLYKCSVQTPVKL